MDKLKETIKLIGKDIYNLDKGQKNLLSLNKAYSLFPTFAGLQWGWFGIKRRGSEGYYPQSSDKERNVTILPIGGLPLGFRPTSSKIGIMMNDKGKRYGTWYVGGSSDKNHVRLQFDDPVPTDRDITDIRFTAMTYTTDDPWPETL